MDVVDRKGRRAADVDGTGDRKPQLDFLSCHHRKPVGCVAVAEAAVQALSKEMARTEAYDLVKQACRVAVTEDRSLIEVVKQQMGQTETQHKIDWEALAQPEKYLGQSQQFIDRVLEQVRAKKTSPKLKIE